MVSVMVILVWCFLSCTNKKQDVQVDKKATTMKMEVVEAVDNEPDEGTYKIRNTEFYSISFPRTWEIIINPDQISDVYIGDSEEKLGFTVLYFETDFSLSDVMEECNSNAEKEGFAIIANDKINLNGQPCYKTVYEFSFGGMDMQQISYTFKKNSRIFNVKFGNRKEEVESSVALIDRIINSFKIK